MTPELIAVLASWASLLSGYPAPEVTVQYVPHVFFSEIVCGNPRQCKRVRGTYLDDLAPGIVFVDDRLRDDDSIYTRGMIVHEIVHVAQHFSGEFDVNDCADSLRRERQADFVQDQFLIRHGRRPQMRLAHAVCAK